MSDYRAIATVTAVIRDILAESLNSVGINVTVKTSSPSDLKEPSNDADILNLFLFQVTTNNVCHTLDSPNRSQDGKLITKPKLALDLHYLLTAASKNELKAQLMLSNAMMALHENAIIPKNKIINTVSIFEDTDDKFLSGSNLACQVESLKISLQALSTEELTKLWSSFFQTGYRLSVAYHVSMVLLESTLEPVPSVPVSKRQLRVVSLKQPVIERIEPQIMTYNPMKRLIIKGHNLSSDKVLVRIDDKEITIEDKDLSENQLSLLIPEDTLAGVKPVQVIQKILFNPDAKEERKGYISNVAAFVLAPQLLSVNRENRVLTLSFEPGIDVCQKVYALIGDYVIPADLPVPSLVCVYPLKTLSVTIPERIFENLDGIYPVRLRVDKADSSFKDENSIEITK